MWKLNCNTTLWRTQAKTPRPHPCRFPFSPHCEQILLALPLKYNPGSDPFSPKTTAFNLSTLSHQLLVGLLRQLLNYRKNCEQKVKRAVEDGCSISTFLYILEQVVSKSLPQYLAARTRNPFKLIYTKMERKCSQNFQGMRTGSWKVRNGESALHFSMATFMLFVCLLHSPVFQLSLDILSFNPGSTWLPSADWLAWSDSTSNSHKMISWLGWLQVSASDLISLHQNT